MKAAVGKAVRLRECPFRELPLHLKAFHKEGNHFADFGVQTMVNLWVMDKCLIPGGSSIPRYRDLKLELGSEPNPLVRPEPNPLVRDL